jgi:hypothetical protein
MESFQPWPDGYGQNRMNLKNIRDREGSTISDMKSSVDVLFPYGKNIFHML